MFHKNVLYKFSVIKIFFKSTKSGALHVSHKTFSLTILPYFQYKYKATTNYIKYNNHVQYLFLVFHVENGV